MPNGKCDNNFDWQSWEIFGKIFLPDRHYIAVDNIYSKFLEIENLEGC